MDYCRVLGVLPLPQTNVKRKKKPFYLLYLRCAGEDAARISLSV